MKFEIGQIVFRISDGEEFTVVALYEEGFDAKYSDGEILLCQPYENFEL